jgi:hypothetical protein
MKLPKSAPIKQTLGLFLNKYQYKISIVTYYAGWFRNKKLDEVLEKLNNGVSPPSFRIRDKFKNEKQYCLKLQKFMSTLENYDIRVSHPTISFYSNNIKHIEELYFLDESRVKFVCLPNENSPPLEKNTIFVKKLDYQYKLHITPFKHNCDNFLSWCEDNPKVKLTGSIKNQFQKGKGVGGYFYVKDDNTLTIVRLLLGTNISRILNVIKV